MALLLRFRRNFLLKVLTDILTKVLTFLFILLVARGLRSEGFGIFSAAQSIAAMVVVLADLGIHLLVTREIAARRLPAPQLVGNLFSVKVLLSGLVLVILGLLTLTARFSDLRVPLLITGGFMVFWSMLEFFSSVACGFERMEWETLLKGLGRTLVVVLGGGALAAGWGLHGVLIGMAVAPAVVVLAAALVVCWRDASFRPYWDRAVLRQAMAQALPLAAVSFLVTLFVRVDIVMLEALRGDHREIGIYAAAIRVIDALGAIPLLFSSALFPIYSDLVHSDAQTVRSLVRAAVRIMAFIGVPILVGGLALAPWGVHLLYGSEYAETATALRLLLADIPFLYVNVQFSSLAIAAGRQRTLAVLAGATFLTNVGLNALLIPRYGYRGSAVTTVLTELLLLILISVVIMRRLAPLGFPRFLWRYGVAGLAMAGALAPLAGIALPGAVLFSLLLYVASLWVLGEMGGEDLRRLRRFVAGRGGKGGLDGPRTPRLD